MRGTVLPYSPADTATAERFLPFVGEAYHRPGTVADCDAAARAAVAKLERLGLISGTVAALILEAFDLAPFDLA